MGGVRQAKRGGGLYPQLTCTKNNDKMHKIKPEQKSLDKDLFRRKPDDKGVRHKLSAISRRQR